MLADLRQTNARLIAGQDVSGTVFVRDVNGGLVAELRNAPGQVSTVGLSAGTYRVTVEREGEVLGGEVEVAAGTTTRVNPAALRGIRRIRRERTVARGDAAPAEVALPTYQPVRFGFLPDLTVGPAFWMWPNASGVHAVNLNLFIGSSAGIRGADMAGVMTIAHGPVTGAQTAGVVAVDTLRGFQGAGVATVARGSLAGAQASGVFSWASADIAGFQGSGVYGHTVGAYAAPSCRRSITPAVSPVPS